MLVLWVCPYGFVFPLKHAHSNLPASPTGEAPGLLGTGGQGPPHSKQASLAEDLRQPDGGWWHCCGARGRQPVLVGWRQESIQAFLGRGGKQPPLPSLPILQRSPEQQVADWVPSADQQLAPRHSHVDSGLRGGGVGPHRGSPAVICFLPTCCPWSRLENRVEGYNPPALLVPRWEARRPEYGDLLRVGRGYSRACGQGSGLLILVPWGLLGCVCTHIGHLQSG